MCRERVAELARSNAIDTAADAAGSGGIAFGIPGGTSSNNSSNVVDLARMVESGDIDPDRILLASPQTVNFDPSDGRDLQSVISEAKHIADRRNVLQQAYLRFSCLARMSYNSGLDFERYYRDLYEDILKYHDTWFDKLFHVDTLDSTPAEFTTGILGTLCTILRQRGDLEECSEVMKTYMAVLKRYQQMTEGCGIQAQVDCCEGLTFKANLIRLNLGAQIGDKKMTMTAFHDVVRYEKKEKALGRYDVENSPDMDGTLECFFGHSDYDSIDDDDIYRVLTFMNNDASKDGPQLKPRECGYWNCKNKEQMRGDFNLCSKCHKQAYCGRDCQVKDWKIHKLLCCGKNKTKVEDETLLIIVEQVVQNHAATVDLRSEKKVSTKQKDAATAALVKKFMKMFTGEFSHFNSPTKIGDAGTDPAVAQAIADFFAQQPGFDKVWGELRVGYGKRLELEREEASRSNKLTVSESVIRDVCKEMALHCTVVLGSIMCDGDSTKSLSKHETLLDELVAHTTEFMKEHKEFDSYDGLERLGRDPDYMKQVAIIVCEVYECGKEEVGDLQDSLQDSVKALGSHL